MLTLDELLLNIEESPNAALVLGAGISFSMGIPGGYGLPIEFAGEHLSLMSKLGLEEMLHDAQHTKDRGAEAKFVEALVVAFRADTDLQKALSQWLAAYPNFEGPISDDHPIGDSYSDEHAIFVLAWLQGLFSHMMTTNWDFLLEWHVATLHDQVYWGELFQPLSLKLKSGTICHLDPHQLFLLETLDDNEVAWKSRWDIISNANNLDEVQDWSRVIWKIHGSPFLLACPKCGAWGRWKLSKTLEVGDPCPDHQDTALVPEIVFWGKGIDTAHPQVWSVVKSLLEKCDLIVVCGLSGSGNDSYIREAIESHENTWIVDPSGGSWNLERVNIVNAYASELSSGLLSLLR